MKKFKAGDNVLLKAIVVEVDPLGGKTCIITTTSSSGKLYTNMDDLLHIDEQYNRGGNDAWEIVKKICLPVSEGGFSSSEIREIFGCSSLDEIFRNYTFREAKEKSSKLEEEKIIPECGSIVERGDGVRGIVTGIKNSTLSIVWSNGRTGEYNKDSVKKTDIELDVSCLFNVLKTLQ